MPNWKLQLFLENSRFGLDFSDYRNFVELGTILIAGPFVFASGLPIRYGDKKYRARIGEIDFDHCVVRVLVSDWEDRSI